MKKLFSLFTLAAMLFAFTACSDDDDYGTVVDPTDPVEDTDQFLIMFYGVGGDNLDAGIIQNIMQSLSVGSTDKVKMTYQYRFSAKYQTSEKVADKFKNIMRFTADDNKELVGMDWSDSIQVNNAEAKLKVTNIGDANYVMACDTALTSFIEWSKKLYPNAKKTMLLLSDHGGGWNLILDGARDYASASTRNILSDDNSTMTVGDDTITRSMSLGDVQRGISNATSIGGKVDVLYDDACLMSTWENLTGYADVAHYFVGSVETAPGYGGEYEYLLSRLNNCDMTDEGIHTAMKGYVDDVIVKWWEPINESFVAGKTKLLTAIYGDLAVYDLQQIGTPLSVISEVSKTLVEKYNSEETIPGINDEDHNKWSDVINEAITGCEISTNAIGKYYRVLDLPQSMFEFLVQLAGGYDIFVKDSESGDFYCPNVYVLQALHMMTPAVILTDSEHQKYLDLWNIISNNTYDSYSLSDFLVNIANTVKLYGSDDTTFEELAKKYNDALESFGYIRCTLPITTTKFTCEFQLCSPGIFIYPFNENVYGDEFSLATRYRKYLNVNNALLSYTSTEFDQKTSWSKFLQQITVAPSVILNPVRAEYK